jgi:hypothetical protein
MGTGQTVREAARVFQQQKEKQQSQKPASEETIGKKGLEADANFGKPEGSRVNFLISPMAAEMAVRPEWTANRVHADEKRKFQREYPALADDGEQGTLFPSLVKSSAK